jgi:hypothetical protein
MHLPRFTSLLAALALGLGVASAAQAASSPYAGTYYVTYMDKVSTGKAQFGTLTISASGSFTIKVTTYVGGSGGQNIPGQVSSAGTVTINGVKNTITTKWLKQGTFVYGVYGILQPYTPSHSKGGIFLATKE